MTNAGSAFLSEYGHRWDIESGYRSIVLRFFYFACLLYSIWGAVDFLVQVELTGEYEHAPVLTANTTLTLRKKETGIGS